MNAKEFEVFADFCPHFKIDYYPSVDIKPIFYCGHKDCKTVKQGCSRLYCPLLREIKEKKHDR